MPDEQTKNNPALDALTFFVSQYSPATKDTAQFFWSTNEIGNAIADLTGKRLEAEEIYKLMKEMGYNYDTLESLEAVWMFKKE